MSATEFDLSDAHFARIRQLIKSNAGIELGPSKRNLAYSRLKRRVKALSLSGFSDYLEVVSSDNDELTEFVNAMTTNFTSFFREGHHFTYLTEELLPHLLQTRTATKRLRFWSAGCSSGQEPYTIAMTVLDVLGTNSSWDFKILATDLDANVLATAQAGVYSESTVEDVPESDRSRWFVRGRGTQSGKVAVKPALRDTITFKQLNLMGPWPMHGPFDAIFCRNVVIYFDNETKAKLVTRFHPLLADDGRLFMGHSESLLRSNVPFVGCGRSVYRKEG